MYGYIYKITCQVDNNKIYIGKTTKTIEERFRQHVRNSKSKSYKHASYLYNAMRKYGVDNFIIETIEVCDTKESLNQRERYWIANLNAQNPNVGYNIHEGGEGGRTQLTYECTPKQLECLSIGWHLPMSEENKALVSKIHSGKQVSAETREKLRVAQLGKKASDETKRKQSEAHKGKKMPYRDEASRERYRNGSSGRIHIHKDSTNKNVKAEELDYYLSQGWQYGYFYKK